MTAVVIGALFTFTVWLVWCSVRTLVADVRRSRRQGAETLPRVQVSYDGDGHWYDLDAADLGEDNPLVNEWCRSCP